MNVDERLQAIEDRNARVEIDKAWEVSVVRRGFIALVTYACATIVLWSLSSAKPLLDALIPTGGYILSTLSLPPLKRWWVNRRSQS
jgi:hypothetical protein